MVEKRVDAALELVADIDPVVGLTRAGEEHGVDAVRLEPRADLLGVSVGIAGEREDGVKRGDADGAVVAVVKAAVAVPGDQQLGAGFTHNADKRGAQFRSVLDEAVRPAQKDAAARAQLGGGGFLLSFAQRRQIRRREIGILAPFVPAGHEAKRHIPAIVGQRGDSAAAGEFNVVRVRHNDKGAARLRRVGHGEVLWRNGRRWGAI